MGKLSDNNRTSNIGELILETYLDNLLLSLDFPTFNFETTGKQPANIQVVRVPRQNDVGIDFMGEVFFRSFEKMASTQGFGFYIQLKTHKDQPNFSYSDLETYKTYSANRPVLIIWQQVEDLENLKFERKVILFNDWINNEENVKKYSSLITTPKEEKKFFLKRDWVVMEKPWVENFLSRYLSQLIMTMGKFQHQNNDSAYRYLQGLFEGIGANLKQSTLWTSTKNKGVKIKVNIFEKANKDIVVCSVIGETSGNPTIAPELLNDGRLAGFDSAFDFVLSSNLKNIILIIPCWNILHPNAIVAYKTSGFNFFQFNVFDTDRADKVELLKEYLNNLL